MKQPVIALYWRKSFGTKRTAQEERRTADPWEDHLRMILDTITHTSPDGFDRVASADILTDVLQIPKAQQTSAHGQRLARVRKQIGWERNTSGHVTINGVPVRGYIRRTATSASPDLVPSADESAFREAPSNIKVAIYGARCARPAVC
jgi:hypothetical protein